MPDLEGSEARVAYGEVASPIGSLTVLVSRRGVLAISFGNGDLNRILESVASKVSPSPEVHHSPAAIGEARSWLEAYFSGQLLPEPALDRSLITPFQGRVLRATATIPPGEVRTYGEVATMVGNPKAARATGRALGANPISIVLPCHRVVAASGRLHGYGGGLDRKRFLLEHERSIMGG